MAQFRKRHLVIEAVQFQATPAGQALKFNETPPWLAQALGDGTITGVTKGANQGIIVKTGEGAILVPAGHWIARTADGELSLWHPEMFAATYEAVPVVATPAVKP